MSYRGSAEHVERGPLHGQELGRDGRTAAGLFQPLADPAHVHDLRREGRGVSALTRASTPGWAAPARPHSHTRRLGPGVKVTLRTESTAPPPPVTSGMKRPESGVGPGPARELRSSSWWPVLASRPRPR